MGEAFMVKYDPKILQKYAEILYRDAGFVVFVVTILGILVGIMPGIAAGQALSVRFAAPENQTIVTAIIALVVTFIFAIVGYLVGQAIAFWYRLKAQLTLCQKQIEYNTRSATVRRQATQLDEIIP
jgi:Zn-dependent protease with chaperone function